MTNHEAASSSASTDSTPSALTVAVNILTSPSEAFAALEQKPTKLFPLALILLSSVAVLFWYFSIVDFEWYVDDALSQSGNLSAEQLENARDAMLGMSPTTFRLFGVLGSTVGILAMYVLQAGYLSMASALNGDKYRFGHWFSVISWSNLPYLLGTIGMAVTILLSPNGQISAYDLNPLTLANLGMNSDNASVATILNALNLTMFWSLGLTALAYHQWLQASWLKTLSIVLAPYLLIFGIWAYFALV